MSEDIKKKIAYTWRGLLLIAAGIGGALVGLGIMGELVDAGKYGHLIVTILGIAMILIGINALYSAYVLPRKKEKQKSKEPEVRRASKSNIPKEQLEILKELYDSDVITEAEFEEKKKQLLGL